MKCRTDKGNLCGTLNSGKPPPLSLLNVANLTILQKKYWLNLKKFSVQASTHEQEKSQGKCNFAVYIHRGKSRCIQAWLQTIGNYLSNFSSSLRLLQEFCMNGRCSSVSWMWLNSGQPLHLELTFHFFTSAENSTINSRLRSGWGSVKHEWRFSYVNKIAVNSFNKTSTSIEQQPVHTASFTSSCARLNRQGLGCTPLYFLKSLLAQYHLRPDNCFWWKPV